MVGPEYGLCLDSRGNSQGRSVARIDRAHLAPAILAGMGTLELSNG